MRYRVMDHTADTGIVAYGSTFEEALGNAGLGMFDLMFGIAGRSPIDRIDVSVEAPTREDLVVAWLSELLFRSEVDDVCGVEYDVRLKQGADDLALDATVGVIPLSDVELVGPPIKAVTYHELEVRQVGGRWEIQVIFDV